MSEEHLDDARTQATLEVLSREFEQIWNTRADFASEADYRAAVHAQNQSAICLSGGGIRSAAFSLGVIQALAQKGLLTRFHYLSTVSGGGYIGAWLCRWINDEVNHDACIVEKTLACGFEKPTPNPPEIQELRENSNYLTPKVGLMSVDFWTAITLSARNIILNWLIFLPALLSIAAFFNFYFELLKKKTCIQMPPLISEWNLKTFKNVSQSCPVDSVLFAAYWIIGSVALFVATFYTHRYLPSVTPVQLNARQIIQRVVIPTFIFSLVLPLLLSFNLAPSVEWLATFVIIWPVTILAGVTAATAIISDGKKHGMRALSPIAIYLDSVVWIFASAVLAGALIVALWVAEQITNANYRLLLVVATSPLLLIWSQTLQAAFYTGFRRQQFRADADREWLARLSAMRVLPAQMWMLFAVVCLAFPVVVPRVDWLSRSFGALALLSGFVAVIGGKNASLSYRTRSSNQRKLGLSISAVINVATAIFVTALFTGLALLDVAGEQAAHQRLNDLKIFDRFGPNASNYEDVLLFLLILCLAVLFVRMVGRHINVNRFSLHGVYRNRLVRAFLGGARRKRNPDLFTGFDPNDNIRMHELEAFAVNERVRRRILFPVINLTMNLVRADKRAWQERKAASFTVTPLSCGSAMLGGKHEDGPTPTPPGCFVPSRIYGGAEPDLGNLGNGISLGTAMTISGAAASPSMGYHSSPATAFLMTLFNVRLGAWLGNPASPQKSDLTLSSPNDALRPLYSEMFGQTNDRGRDIYLSDGGHFENLGLYEMVRRRCRFIFVVDGDCDPDCHLEDLGNAIRKIYIDQNIEIEFEKLNLSSRGVAEELNAVAVGRIRYPDPSCEHGWIIYLKASYSTLAVPADVRAYGEANLAFPHESTMNQWFKESQFESYRKLGNFLAGKLGNANQRYNDLAVFFADVCKVNPTSV